MLAIVDYGVGNLFSLRSSLRCLGVDSVVSGDADTLLGCDRLLLPGVGAFGDAAAKLRQSGLDRVVLEAAASGKPLLGICLGMQLLFDSSLEYGRHPGLGLLPGQVVPMADTLPRSLSIPHIGWNSLRFRRPSPLLRNTRPGDHVYFVHSYYVDGENESCAADTEYGVRLAAVVQRDNIFGCQFHPEKSGAVGLGILKSFCEL